MELSDAWTLVSISKKKRNKNAKLCLTWNFDSDLPIRKLYRGTSFLYYPEGEGRRRRLSSSSTWTQWLHIHAVITEGIQSSHTWRQFVHTDAVTTWVCICTICLQVTTKQQLSLAKLTRKFELRMGFLFLSGGDTVFCSIFINRHKQALVFVHYTVYECMPEHQTANDGL